MNIKCDYCGGMFDETLEKCPSCGAANSKVKRSTVDQPTTIEELKDWYQSKGLPPYETTRFFIGENYKGARAFGIYKDEHTGKCVVYKNKDTGQRAVRYEGTDEAYAVNELFMRIKQEILQQKARNVDSGNIPKNDKKEAESEAYSQFKKEYEYKQKARKTIFGGVIAALVICLFFGIFAHRAYLNKLYVYPGYYEYNGNTYYHLEGNDFSGWLAYSPDSGEWGPGDVYASPLVDPRKSREFFVSGSNDSSLGCTDVQDSDAYKEEIYGHYVSSGYYNLNDKYYYHEEDFNDEGWFVYNPDQDDWDYVYSSYLPKELTHQYSAMDYVYIPVWENGEIFGDVKKSLVYKHTYPQKVSSYPTDPKAEGYYKSGDEYYYHNSSASSRDWYIFSTDKNDWVSTSFIPDDVVTVNYSSSTSISDFTTSSAYINSQNDSYSSGSGSNTSYSSGSSSRDSDSWWSSSDSSWDSDSSWSWSSSDSWDSGSTDWSSDW